MRWVPQRPCMRSRRVPTLPPLSITDGERAELQRWVRAHTTPQRAAKRARVVLLAAEGVPNRQIATLVGMNQHTVSHWRHRFEAERLAGLKDRPRPGRPLVYGHDQRLRILATVTPQPPPRPATGAIPSWPRRWPTSASRPPRSAGSWPTSTSSPTGCAAGSPALTIPPSGSARPMSAGCIWHHPPMRWCSRSMRRPGSVPAAAPGRPPRQYRDARPAKNTSTCATAPRPCWPRWTSIMAGSSRPPTWTATPRLNFIAFLDDLDAKLPTELAVHLVLDNGSSHLANQTRWWFVDHPRFRAHYPPTHASWLNQVELFFSILTRRLLKRGEFASVEDLVGKVMAFIDDDNRTAKPFRWTYDGRPLKAN